MRAALAAVLVGACAGPGAPAASAPTIDSMAELARLMKDEINAPFSRLTFLVFHGAEVEADPVTLADELSRNAALLREAIGRLRALRQVPTRTDEGRAVFEAYTESVERSTTQLVDAIAAGAGGVAAAQLERIAETCNDCHHFFRLKIEDTVVPRSAQLEPGATVAVRAALPTPSDEEPR